MKIIIDEFHEKLMKYIDDDDLVISIHENVESESDQKKLIRKLAQGYTASVQQDEDRNDGAEIELTKNGETLILNSL